MAYAPGLKRFILGIEACQRGFWRSEAGRCEELMLVSDRHGPAGTGGRFARRNRAWPFEGAE